MPEDPRQFVLLPAIARRKYKALIAKYDTIAEDPDFSSHNVFTDGPDKSLGIIASGIAYNYLMENSGQNALDYPVLKISKYPFSEDIVRKITDQCKEILVIEEGYPLIEEMLNSFGMDTKKVHGRLDGSLPRDGELNPNIVARSLKLDDDYGYDVPEIVKSRPPSLCKGCSHADMYNALNIVMADYGPGRVFSDIGCYTLGFLAPYNAINSCVDMGASVTMAVGAADAGLVPSVAVIGDSTFTHSGMTGLLDAVIKNSPVTVIISDNSTTGMTGGQVSHATNRLEDICAGLGVEKDHIIKIVPLRKNHDENVEVMRREIAYNGVSVIISARECIQTAARKKKEQRDN
jgi:indolepyruvate ferredoxin oxidoreductase alpha subunit